LGRLVKVKLDEEKGSKMVHVIMKKSEDDLESGIIEGSFFKMVLISDKDNNLNYKV
jgi:hypothetical protein